MVDSNRHPTALGPYGLFTMNIPNRGFCLGNCQGVIATNSTQSGFTGNSADWIIERISLTGCGTYTDLANYGTSKISMAFAKVYGCPYELNYLGAGNYANQIAMISCSNDMNQKLSTVAAGNYNYHGADMTFTWHLYN